MLSVGAFALSSGSAVAATPTVNCDTAAQPSTDWTTCGQLVGTAKCVWNNGDGTWTMAMGYTNPTTSILNAAIPNAAAGVAGTNNALTATSGSAANPSHLASFPPGTSTTAFTVTWTPSSKTDPVTWALMGHTYTFVDTMTACTSKPVPVVANETFGGIAVAAVLGTVLVRRRRLRPLAAKKGIATA
ncbi:hypothetical protein acdb102_49450 [Acidothermaceae bacterium B102]|nr:hypothetical protein acdb102_49450 [Acidothermaceae bacterium B102]